jgi:CheY-like chemotaxis protein
MTIMRPEGSRQGGVLKIRSSRIHSDHVMNELYPDTAISDSDWVRIEVSDTGIGMNEETRLKIFEPFFTTKQKEKGSGLGLAISYNIIRQHRGIIHVYSEPEKGSCFYVYLPAYSNVGEADLRQKTAGTIVSGSGTILVIDDEAVMCQVAMGILEKCGYQVVTAESGDEGIRIYRERSDEISAVLLDLSMPGKSGLEVYEELAAVNRDVRVVLASGMLDASSLEAAEQLGIRRTVQKPYLVHELSTVIRSVIDS